MYKKKKKFFFLTCNLKSLCTGNTVVKSVAVTQMRSHVVDVYEGFEKLEHIEEFAVVFIFVPALDGDAI